MKQIEFKDLSYCKTYIVAYKNKKKNCWIPAFVNVIKEYTVKLIKHPEIAFSPLENGVEYSIKDFYYSYIGKDIFENKIYALNVFRGTKECSDWCKFENRLIRESKEYE